MLSRIAGFYFYGSFHIGLGAMAMTWMSVYNLDLSFDAQIQYLLAILFGTIGFYAFHRIYDLNDLKIQSNAKKYMIISSLLYPIKVVIFTTSVIALILYFFILPVAQLIIAIAAILTLWYTLPFGNRGKKLREYAHVKIFIIALVWGIVTAGLPAYLSGMQLLDSLLITAERSIFIFALTLPFDIRDYLLDHSSRIKTLPIWIGTKWSLRLSVFLIVVVQSILIFVIFRHGLIQLTNFILLLSTNLMVACFVAISAKMKNDYYFTGILDGMLILQPFVIFLYSL